MQRTVSAPRLVSLLGSATTGAGPAYQSLADGIRLLVADGRVPVGTRLPSERDLTTALGVSRTTVTRAYAVLRDGGYLTSRQGSGSVASLPGAAARRSPSLTPRGSDDGAIDLTCAALASPAGYMAACEQAVAALPTHLAGTGYDPMGLPALREALAEDFTARGLPTSPEEVMVTSGALAAFSAVTRALLGPGDRILMENPTYPNAIETARRSGARPVALPMDPSGWDTDAVVAALRQTAPRAAYLIPDFHNPTGALMGDEQREAIGAALRATRTLAIVDETTADLDLREGGAPRPQPFGSFHGQTVTIGGASKTWWGGLRIGWARGPRDLLTAVADARLTLDLSAPVLEQLVMLELLPHRDEAVAQRVTEVRGARDAVLGALAEHLPDWRVTSPDGGLCLWIELPAPLSTALVVAAERHGVLLASGSQFAVEGSLERFVRIPLRDRDPEVMVEAVRRMAEAWVDAQTGPTTRPGRARLVA